MAKKLVRRTTPPIRERPHKIPERAHRTGLVLLWAGPLLIRQRGPGWGLVKTLLRMSQPAGYPAGGSAAGGHPDQGEVPKPLDRLGGNQWPNRSQTKRQSSGCRKPVRKRSRRRTTWPRGRRNSLRLASASRPPAQEAQIRQTIAQLTKDAADLSAEVAELEPRMQEARDAEAAAQQEIANTREQLTSSLDEARTPSNAQQSWAPGTSNLPRISRRRNSGAPRSRHS